MDKTILVVEDSRTQALMLENILQRANYSVVIVSNGLQAIDWLSVNQPLMVISDIMMPEMDGYELCKRIKTQHTTQKIPVILLTSLNGVEEVLWGLNSGADSFVIKPYDGTYLLSHIEKVLADCMANGDETKSFGAEIIVDGKKRHIKTSEKHIIQLLLNIYEGSIQQNKKLLEAQENMRILNENLESLVDERTEKLESQNALLHALFNSPGDMIIFSLDTNYCYTTFNENHRREMKRIWNVDIHPGTNLLECMSNIQVREIAKRSIDHVLNGKFLSEIQYHSEVDIYYEFNWNPILQNNEVMGVTVFIKDITDRKRTEIKLQDSEQNYRRLVDNSLVGVSKTKVNGEVIYVNDTTVRMLEFDSREELIAAGAIMRYKNPAQRDELVRILKNEGRVERFEANVLTQKGNERTFLYSLILEGDIIEGTLIDITDRKRAERAVIENQQFLKSITSEVQEVIFALDAQGIFTFSEGKGLEKLGLKPGQVVGMSVFNLYKDFPEIIVGVKEALDGKMVKTEALEIGSRNYSTTYQPIFDENGQLTSVVGLAVDVTEAKIAEKALQQSKRELATLMNNLPGMVYSCLNDQNWTMKFVSEGVLDLTGYLPDDLIGNKTLTFEEIILPEDRMMVWTTIQASLEAKASYDLEYRIVEKSGFIKHVWERGQGIFNDNGDLLSLEGFITDITARKRAEDALQEANDTLERRVLERTLELAKSKKLLDETSRMARIGGWELNLADNQQTWTKMVYHIHEVDLDFNPTLNSGISFYAPEAIPVISEAVRLAIAEGKPYDLELPFITAKQNRLWVRTIGRAIWEDDKIVRLGGVFQDITEQKYAADELTKYREHLEELVKDRTEKLETQYALLNALINSPGDMQIFSLDTNYCYTAFNEKHSQEMKEIWNTDIQIGTNILKCMNIPEIRVLAKRNIDRVLNGEGFTEVQHESGNDIYSELSWNPILLGNDIVGATVFVKDISERKRTEIEVQIKNEQLVKVNAEKDKFFSIIAHDLRSPLSSFLGLTEIIDEDLPNMNIENLKEMVASMKSSAENVYRLLENLLQWAKVQRGLVPFDPVVVSLFPIMNEAITIIRESAINKNITVKFDIPDDLEVFADKNMLQTVIRNLISNAVKFTRKGGEININAKKADAGNVEISIGDTGIGMSPEMLSTLFEISNKSGRKGTEGEPSSGLGLILCREFIEKLGGRIRVESEVGVGSKFSFTIPLSVIPEQTSDQIESVLDQTELIKAGGLNVLIADDDESSGRLIAIIVNSFAAKIIRVKNGLEEVKAFRENPNIDLIITDIHMPEMNGYEAVKQIRQMSEKVIIIAMTDFAQTGEKEIAQEAGCTDYVSKPIRKDQLRGLLKKYFTGD